MDVGVDVDAAFVGLVGAEDLAVVVQDLEDGALRHGWVTGFAAALEEAEGGDGDEEGEGVVAFTLGLAEAWFCFDDAHVVAGVGKVAFICRRVVDEEGGKNEEEGG